MSPIPSGYEFEWPSSVAALSAQPELILTLLDFLRLDYDAIFLRELDASIIYWNPNAAQLYGWQAEEAQGQRSHDLLRTQFSDLPLPLDELLVRDGVWEGQLVHQTRDGREITVESRQVLLRGPDGLPLSVLETNRDITRQRANEEDRRRIEGDLHTTLGQLEAVLESADTGIIVQSAQFDIIYANDAAARLCGAESGAALHGVTIADILQDFELLDEHGAPFPVEKLPARQALTHGETAEALIRTRSAREEHWAISRARPVRDETGGVGFIVSAFHDVTAIKTQELRERFLDQAGALLSESLDYETTLTRVAELAVPDLADWASVHLIERDGSLRQVALAHSDPARVAWAQELATRYPPNPEATSGVPAVIRSGQPEFFADIPQEVLDLVAQDADLHRIIVDELRLASYLIVPLRARGTVLGAITFVYGDSQRHYTAAELSLAQQLADRAAQAVDNARLYRDALAAIHVRDEFLASVSHDLRTPLTTIRGSAELAVRQLRRIDNAAVESPMKTIGNVVEAAERMERMIASLLDLARLESGRPAEIEPEWMDLVSLARELGTQHQRGAPEREIVVEATTPVLRGLWDPMRIERVIDNLLSNAVKYSQIGTSVRLRVAIESDDGAHWARLDVEDHGIGVPTADLPHIFERFHRGSNVSARTPGIGIGLAGAKQIAELHNGSLTVASEEGTGSRFTLRLPLTNQDEEK